MSQSRREFLRSAVAGAVVCGFDVQGRSWVTRASADPEPGAASGPGIAGLPALAGELRTTGVESYAADFGRIASRQPHAVLFPGSIDDIAAVIRFARAHRLHVAANGLAGTYDLRESHSSFGQAQVAAGIAIDMSRLGQIFSITGDTADVGAGAHWAEVFDAAAPYGAAPPVFTDYVHLSVGGTLSVGGLGGASHAFGIQADNVLELEVVTGRGDRVRCSPSHQRELFDAVLAGAGQCGIIVRARLRLVPADSHARVFQLVYDDLDGFLADQLALVRDGRFSYVEGQVVRRPDDTGWRFVLEAASWFTPPRAPDDGELLLGMHDLRGEAQISTQGYRDFIFRLDPTVALLKSIGAWQLPHPWISLFLPATRAHGYVEELLSTLTLADTGQGPILVYPFDTARIRRPLFRVPEARHAFHVSVLRTASPPTPDVVAGMLADNRAMYDRAVAAGGVRYVIGAIPEFTQRDWRRHFGDAWESLVRAKHRFDPDRVLTPGQGMFGR